MILTTLLFVQHTVLEEQALPVPTPMTVIGEQSRPIKPVMGPRTIPSKPRRRLAPAELA